MDDRQAHPTPVAVAVAVAVIGVGALYPGSSDIDGFWRDILSGRDMITEVPPTHWLIEDYYDPDPAAPDKTYGKRGGFIPAVEFDPLEYGIPPTNLPATDVAQLLALVVARRTLDDATGGDLVRLNRARTSVILGVAAPTQLAMDLQSRMQRPVWVKALRESGLPEDEVQRICDRIASSYVPWSESSFPGLLGNVVAGRIANHFDLGGTNCVVDAACASSLSALYLAVMELQAHASDMVLTGGVDALNHILMYTCFSKTPALSATGDCRPFAANADGTMLGEGLGMLALKRLDEAERDGDRIYAVVRGIGTSSDGQATSIYAPHPEGQALALRRAYAAAGYSPATVELVEAHGTATKAGDAAEFEALKTVFAESGAIGRQWCALGSVKSQIGHTKAAAGAAGLLKIVMALHHKVLPPTIKVDEPNPTLDLPASPFYLNTQARPWIRDGVHPRRAAVSSFGFGGSNYHVAVEEYSGPGRRAWRTRSVPGELVLLSAESPSALAALCAGTAKNGLGSDLADLARASQERFEVSQPCRLAITATDDGDLRRKLTQAADMIASHPDQAIDLPAGLCYATGRSPGEIAFLFPGQGSQYVGMGADLAMAFEVAREVWDVAASAPLAPGACLHEVVFPRPAFSEHERHEQARRLIATEWAQPALGAVSLSQLALLRLLGVTPDCVGGHSFGEVSALCAAGVLEPGDCVRIARRRGELMAAAAEVRGAMVAVSSAAAEILPRLEGRGLDVVLANDNSTEQVVFAGTTAGVEELETWLVNEGIGHKRLPVATAFHSPLVSPAAAPFAEFLGSVAFHDARMPVYANATAAPYPRDAGAMRRLLAEQIARPVRFREEIELMYAAGVRTFVEVGPGAVLTGLVDQTLGERPHMAIPLERKGQHGVLGLWQALGRLAVAGVHLDFDGLWAEYARPRPAAPDKKVRFAVPINGAPVGKPYPPRGGAAALPRPNVPTTTSAPAVVTSGLSVTATGPAASATPLGTLVGVAAHKEDHVNGHTPRVAAQSVPPLAPHGDTDAGTATSHPSLSTAVIPGATHANSAVHPAQGNALLDTFNEWQRQMAETQVAYQKAMADSHLAYLQAAQSSLADLAALVTGQQPPSIGEPQPALSIPDGLPMLEIEGVSAPPVPGANGNGHEEHTPWDSSWAVPAHEVQGPPVAGNGRVLPRADECAYDVPGPDVAVAGSSAGDEVTAASPPAPEMDVRTVLLAVVAAKTGYPVEMLELDMELEAGLGIDSIKRVEILAALQERMPALPAVEPGQLAMLQTLGQIIAFMQQNGGASRDITEPTEGAAHDVVGPAAPAVEITRPDPLPATQAATPPPTAEIARYVVREAPAAPTGFAMPGLLRGGGPVVITDDGRGTAALLAKRLHAYGVDARPVEVAPPDSQGVIILAGLRLVRDEQDALAVNHEAFEIARGVAAHFAVHGGLFVTVQDTGGDFGLSGRNAARAWMAGLAGLAKTAAAEWTQSAVKTIDLDSAGRAPEEMAEALADELLFGGPEREVGLHADGSRTTLRAVRAAPEQGAPVLDAHAVIAASGGARGVTAAALLALTREAPCRFALLGRTPLRDESADCLGARDQEALQRVVLARAQPVGESLRPAEVAREARQILAVREVRTTLAALAHAGCEARYIAVDVQDERAVAAALARVRAEWGPITGLVHGAGVLADKLIAQKTPEQFHRVFDTKVQGLRALIAATADDPLAFMALFSSAAARDGNAGQCDYAMANEVLNKVACAEAWRRGAGCLVRSLGWGPWDGGMVDEALKAHFAERSVAVMPVEAGAAAFARELRGGGADQVEVIIGAEAPGAGILAPSVDRAWTMELLVNEAAYPFLRSHRIQGVPVVPVVLVLEWFIRAARACRPDLHLTRFEDLTVVRGIRLDGFEQADHVFELRGRTGIDAGGPETLTFELRHPDGHLHYTATACAGRGAPERDASRGDDGSPTPWPWTVSDIYDDKLFHGPDLHAIRALGGVSDLGAAATLAGIRELGWAGVAWHTDAVALDGGLQLAMLWGIHMHGRPSLPTRIREIELYQAELPQGPIHCALRARIEGDYRTVSDITLSSLDGDPIAELRGVEMHWIETVRDSKALAMSG